MAPTAAMLMLDHHHHTGGGGGGGGSTSNPPPVPADSPTAVKWVLNYFPKIQETPPQPKQYNKRDQSQSPSSSYDDSDSSCAWGKRFQEVLDLIYW